MLHPSFSVRARRLAAATADRVLFRDLDLTLTAASRCGVVGPNGVGKSTLLRLLAGEVRPEVGTVERTPASTTVALVPQEPERSPVETVVELVAGRTGVAAANRELETAAEALGASTADSTEGADRYDRALDRYTRLGCADFDERVAATASRIGLGAHLLDRPTEQLSGGEAARMSLLTVLVAQVDLLLLDEPTNDLDHAGLAMLESLVERSSAGMVIVSHDRVFLEQTVTTVVDLGADGSTATFDGGWLAYLEQRATARRHAEEAYRQYDDERERLVAQARRERTWSQQGVRRAKTSGEPDKNIRFGAWQGAQNSGQRAARSERQLERLTPVDKPWDGWDLRFSIAAADRAGAVVARLDEVTVQRGERTLGPWTLELAWGERLALAGPNGSGKTTLVEVLTGRRPPTSGSVHLGPSVVVGELRQQRLEAASTGDLLAWFLDHSQLTVAEGRSLLAKFGLGADHLARPPASLSTGERTRAELALFQARGVNLLILDEPTNHLDLEAIEQLEAALSTYAGTLLVVSHDRRFLEHVQVDRTRTVEPQPR